jgi:hypothetical protein
VEAADEVVDRFGEVGHWALTVRPGTISWIASVRTGDGGTPSSATQAASCREEAA